MLRALSPVQPFPSLPFLSYSASASLVSSVPRDCSAVELVLLVRGRGDQHDRRERRLRQRQRGKQSKASKASEESTVALAHSRIRRRRGRQLCLA
jgi:hypothetical protein